MTSTPRRVLAFVAAGLLCAVAIGIAVWQMSAPESVLTEPSAATAGTSASVTTTTSSSAEHSYTTTASAPQPKSSQAQIAAPADDPYLAPNAVFNRTEPARPTAVYRPDNVSALNNQQPQDQRTESNYPLTPLPADQSTAPSSAAPSPESTQKVTPGSEPTAQPAPHTASQQDAHENHQDDSDSRDSGPQASPAPQPSHVPEHTQAPSDADAPHRDNPTPQPAGWTPEAPKPREEPRDGAGFNEPTDAEKKAQEEAARRESEELAQLANALEQEASHTNEAPTPAAPTDDRPAAEEPSVQTASLGPSPSPRDTTPEDSPEGTTPVEEDSAEIPEMPSSPAELSGSTADAP